MPLIEDDPPQPLPRGQQHLDGRRQMLLAFGVVIPIVLVGFAEQLGQARRHMDHHGFVAPAGLDQQNFDAWIGRKAVGQHAARTACTDDDVIIGFHGLVPGPGVSSGPSLDQS